MTHPALRPSKRTFPVDVLWCGNERMTRGRGSPSGVGWCFPRNVEKLLLAETAGKTVLHPFGGRSRFGTRMDIDPIVRPDVLADAWLPPYGKDSFDVVILDPPYTHLNAQVKTALFRQYIWIAREKIVWFHTIWMSTYGGVSIEKGYLVRVGDHCQVRCLQFFTPRGRKKQPPVKRYVRGPGMIYNRWLAQPESLYAAEDQKREVKSPTAPGLVKALVCPLCKTGLVEVSTGLMCGGYCRRIYPIVDGIPNMLIPEALPAEGVTA